MEFLLIGFLLHAHTCMYVPHSYMYVKLHVWYEYVYVHITCMYC
jgi:hypothetical protein